MDVKYGPNPQQKKKLLNLSAYLFTLILKDKPYNLQVYFWKDFIGRFELQDISLDNILAAISCSNEH